MDIVKQVADAIDDVPGKPTSLEVARVAIEEYQKALWTPYFDMDSRGLMMPERRRARAQALTSHIMQLIQRYLCDHFEEDGHREASAVLFEALYESGADIITDADRSAAGLPPRGPYGLTADEMRLMEHKHMTAMLHPMPPLIVPRP
jgi:hypothetical protein